MDPAIVTLRARLGAYALHATHDPRETTSAARAAFAKRFLDEVDPDRILPEPERERRARAARSAYFTRIQLTKAKNRRRRATAKQPDDAAKTLQEVDHDCGADA